MRRTLLGYQRRWVADKAQLKVIEKSRRIGLSWCEAYDAVMHAAEDAGNVYYQSFSREMTRGFIDDCAGWADYLNVVASTVGETLIEDGDRQVQAFRIGLDNGREIVAMTSAPRGFRSRGRPGDLGIVDEAAFVDDLEEVLKAALAFLVWGGRIHVLSTHNGEGNPFALLCEDIRKGKQPGSLHKVAFADALADGLAERVLEIRGCAVTPGACAEWAAGIRHIYRHNAAEELDCIPSAGAGSFLAWETIRGIQHADAGRPELYEGGLSWLAIDVARRRHLWVCTALEPVGDVLWTREMAILRDARFSEQRAEVRRMRRQYNAIRIGVDQTGMGEGFFEDLQDEHGRHMVEGFLFTGPTRLMLATSLLARAEDARLRIPDDEDTEADLRSVRRLGGAGGAPRLVSDGSGTDGHADRFWSLAIGCHIAGTGPVEFDYVAAPARRSARVEDGRAPARGWLRPDHSDDWRGAATGAW
ncbi:MAG: hypothetical protein OXC28_07210 [Defluviicoccus sp.]|nr:hypothetical protein [Defluviicoccus sp.]